MSHYSHLVTALVAFSLKYFILCIKVANKIQDVPNARSLRSTQVSRIGGESLRVWLFFDCELMFNSLACWIKYSLMLVVGVSALSVMHEALPSLVFIVWGVVYASLMLALDARWKKFKRGKHD